MRVGWARRPARAFAPVHPAAGHGAPLQVGSGSKAQLVELLKRFREAKICYQIIKVRAGGIFSNLHAPRIFLGCNPMGLPVAWKRRVAQKIEC